METEDLEAVLGKINSDMQRGEGNCVLPLGIESFEKYERKAAKLKDSLELELEERSQVDNVLNFFQDSSKNYLDDDAFYKLDNISGSGTTTTQDAPSSQNDAASSFFEKLQQQNAATASAKHVS